MWAADMAPTLQQNSAEYSAESLPVNPLALAWGEDGEPYLLACAFGIIAPGYPPVKEKIRLFQGIFPQSGTLMGNFPPQYFT